MDIQIRPYVPKDYPQVKAAYQSEGAWYREGVDDEEQLNKKIAQDPQSILVAEREGKILGTISIINDYRMAFFVRLAVLTSERKKGIGTQLLQAAEKILKDKCQSINSIVNRLSILPDGKHMLRSTLLLHKWKELQKPNNTEQAKEPCNSPSISHSPCPSFTKSCNIG